MLYLLALFACRPPTAPPVSDTVTLNLAAINDWHGALYEVPVSGTPWEVMGGLPWLVGTMDAIRAEHPNLIVFDGGDSFQGSWPINASQGMGSVAAFSLLGVDVASVGNHEFDYGPRTDGEGDPLRGALMRAAEAASFQWVATNVVGAEGQPWTPPGIAQTTLISQQGVDIGVIGLSTVDTPQTTLTRNVADLTFLDPVPVVGEAAAALRQRGAEVVVVVGHLTGKCEPPDYISAPPADCDPGGEVARIVEELPDGTVDVIVAGHAHTVLAQRIKDTFVLENRSRGHLIGRLDLVVGPDGVDLDASRLHDPLPIGHAATEPGCGDGAFDATPQQIGPYMVTPSQPAVALVAQLEADAGSLCDPLTCANAPLIRDPDRESGVGNLVADASLRAFPEADIAIQNSGGLRADLPGGTIRREHIQALMPFDNRLLLVEMSGAKLLQLFQIGTSGAHGIIQLSGAAIRLDHNNNTGVDQDGDGDVATWENNFVCGAEIGGAPVDPSATYQVVTTDFLFEGGDHFGPAFEGSTLLQRGPLLREHLFESMAQAACLDDAPLIDAAAPRLAFGHCSEE